MKQAWIATGASDAAQQVQYGTLRLLSSLGHAPYIEVKLTGGRRADIMSVDRAGRIMIVEIKSCLADFQADRKWQEYRKHADYFCFAVGLEFPKARLTASPYWDPAIGIITADQHGGDMTVAPSLQPMNGNRRRHVIARLAHLGGRRLTRLALSERTARQSAMVNPDMSVEMSTEIASDRPVPALNSNFDTDAHSGPDKGPAASREGGFQDYGPLFR